MELKKPERLIDTLEKLESVLKQRRLTDENRALITDSFNYLYERIKQATKLATYDGLTGLLRKEVFGDLLSRMVSFSSRYNTELSLLYLDIDHFKNVNDKYGHPVGDRVLQETSKQVNNTLRDYDLVARIEKATYEVKDKGAGKVGDEMAGRIGGEEFAVVLPVPIKEAIRVAERLRKNVEQNCRFYIRGENDVVNMSETPGLINEYDPGRIINLTVSIGVTSLDHSGIKDKDQLCAKADEALYRAKNSGRNKTVSYRRSQSTSSK